MHCYHMSDIDERLTKLEAEMRDDFESALRLRVQAMKRIMDNKDRFLERKINDSFRYQERRIMALEQRLGLSPPGPQESQAGSTGPALLKH